MSSFNWRELASNFSVALIAQVITLLTSFITALVVPKILGVTEYGYWQLFVFYSNYIGFFYFGLNDGVYLIHGGEARDRIDKKGIASQFQLMTIAHLIFALAIIVVTMMSEPNPDREFVICATAVYLLINCGYGYLGYVFQAMNETKLYSFATVINGITFLVPILALLVFRFDSFRLYIILSVISRILATAYCIWKGKDLAFVKPFKPKKTIALALRSMKVGICLMLANIASMLILGVSRFVIDIVWGIDQFGQLSFSLSIANFFIIFFSQLAMVLFPALRQANAEDVRSIFMGSRSALGLFLPAAYLLYPFIIALVLAWLPQYAEGLSFLALMLPVCVFDGKMRIVGTTYLNVLRKERTLLLINVVTVALSSAGVLYGAYVMSSMYAVVIAPVIAIAIRCVIAEIIVARHLDTKASLISVGELSVSAVFVVSTLALPMIPAALVTAAAYLIYLIAFRKEVRNLLRHAKMIRK